MFVDASALVAIIAHEPGSSELTDALESARVPLVSGIAMLEAVMALRRMTSGTIAEAEKLVRDLLASAHAAEIAITSAETRIAIAAYSRYGKGQGQGQGHPARLNMGDCFAYACATATGCRCCSSATISRRRTSARRWLEALTAHWLGSRAPPRPG